MDSTRRIVLPTGNPGDKFDVRSLEDGRIILVPVGEATQPNRLNRAQCLRAIKDSPLHLRMDWETLRAMTREP